MSQAISNIVVVSDTHCGCRLAICPPGGIHLDDGGEYHPSEWQRTLHEHWLHFWDAFVPEATRGEPYVVVHNGDAIDGVHHNSTTQISHNLEDQQEIAYQLLKPIVERCEGRYYHIRGTEAHVGKSAREEEVLAKRLGAIPNKEKQHARYDLWKWCGPKLIHFLHHIGTTGSQAYEATAVGKELTEEFTEAARWGRQPPDMIVRCLSEDTQILTRNGWRGMDAVHIGDEVLTMHTLTEELQWQAATEKVINQSEPEMIRMTGKGMDVLVTPDHKMVVRVSNGLRRGRPGGWFLSQMGDLHDAWSATGVRSGSGLEVPVSGWYDAKGVDLTDPELWLLGFFMADGSFVRKNDGRRYAMRLHQAAERRHEVEERLRAAGVCDFTVTNNAEPGSEHFDHRHGRIITTRNRCLTWYIRSGDADRLMSFINEDKTLPACMMEMSGGQFEALRAGFHYGDGSKSGNKLFNTNEPMLDQLQELMVKHGCKSSLHFHEYYTTKRGERKRAGVLNFVPGKRSVIVGQKKQGGLISRVSYSGKSWCVCVPNGTLVTRRNGCVAIVGNSHRHRSIEIKIPTAGQLAIAVVTPSWQGKGPFAWKIPGARLSEPQFGGVVIRYTDGELFTRSYVKTPERPEPE